MSNRPQEGKGEDDELAATVPGLKVPHVTQIPPNPLPRLVPRDTVTEETVPDQFKVAAESKVSRKLRAIVVASVITALGSIGAGVYVTSCRGNKEVTATTWSTGSVPASSAPTLDGGSTAALPDAALAPKPDAPMLDDEDRAILIKAGINPDKPPVKAPASAKSTLPMKPPQPKRDGLIRETPF